MLDRRTVSEEDPCKKYFMIVMIILDAYNLNETNVELGPTLENFDIGN